MKKILEILQILVLISVVGLIVWYIFFRDIPTPDPRVDYVYITDTVYLDSVIKIPEPYPIPTPPKTVVIYKTDSSSLDSLSLIIQGKEIIIAGLKDSIAIHHNFLKLYPSNPKLLFMGLKRDSLSLGLLSISGQAQENSWPIDLNQFNYRWNHNSDLSRHPTQSPPIEEKSPIKYFMGGGVDLLKSSPYISGRIQKDWARIILYGDIRFGLLKVETSGIQIGANYELWVNR